MERSDVSAARLNELIEEAVVDAHDEWEQIMGFHAGRVTDVFPERIDDIPPHSRALVFGRLVGRTPDDARLHATAGGEKLTLTASVENGDDRFIGAIWAKRKIEALYDAWPPEPEQVERIVALAARSGVLTRVNAILAEE